MDLSMIHDSHNTMRINNGLLPKTNINYFKGGHIFIQHHKLIMDTIKTEFKSEFIFIFLDGKINNGHMNKWGSLIDHEDVLSISMET